ncbi:hypothetical protein IAQ61_006919 [Plenodomus lingam]|uniref:uncharacterized protein n=1 Tax=Leptosphaeria maculans TaxID=5022 RepID=UPI00331ED7FA|nr:hypothetical protein IAQ61_006919 [Plenodomus lingam]
MEKRLHPMKVNIKFQGITDQGVFDCVHVTDAVDRNTRDNHIGPLKNAMRLQEVNVVVGCLSREVKVSCLNEECKYELGSCFV